MPLRAPLNRIVGALTRSQKRALFLAVDTGLAPLVACAILQKGDLGPGVMFWGLLAALAVVSAAASLSLGLPRIKLNGYELRAIMATARFAMLTTLGLAGLSYAAELPISGFLLAEFGAALLLATVFSRFLMLSALLWVLQSGQQRRRALIYGAGDTGLQMAAALRNHHDICPVAFLDDKIELQAMTAGGLPVLSPARVAEIVRKLRVDCVLLAMPATPARKLAQITRALRALGLDVLAMPGFAQLAGPPPVASAPQQARNLLARGVCADDLPDPGQIYAGRVVMVTGAGGSVGSELCRQLLSHRPRKLLLFEQSEVALYTVETMLRDLNAGPMPEIIPILGSVTDARHIRSSLTEHGTDVVFHCAAYKHVSLVEVNPVAGLANNVLGTRIMAEAALAAGVARFVMISTDKAVRPTSVMGGTKRLAELVVQDMAKKSQSTRFSIVRFGNVLGSSGSVLPRFREQIARGGPITLTDDRVTRYFMTLSEAARLVLVAGAFGGDDDDALQACVFVLQMGEPVRIRDLAERMVAAAGLSLCTPDTPDGDIEIVLTGLRPGEKLHEELFIGQQFLPTPHPKILRARERCLSEFEVASALSQTRQAVAAGDQAAARHVLHSWVEGFPGSYAIPQTGIPVRSQNGLAGQMPTIATR